MAGWLPRLATGGCECALVGRTLTGMPSWHEQIH
jgi:hypothetical protein